MAGSRRIDSKVMDAETKGILFDGASISQLGKMFGMDNRTVTAKLTGLEPCGKRAGHPIYAVKDAAPHLVEPMLDLNDIETVITYVRKLNHANLPKMLTKEFWTAMRAKQAFEEDAGDLWRTEKVIEVYSDLVKAVRIPLVLAQDSVANEVELTSRVQQIIGSIIDGILEELHDAVVKQFGSRATEAAITDDDF